MILVPNRRLRLNGNSLLLLLALLLFSQCNPTKGVTKRNPDTNNPRVDTSPDVDTVTWKDPLDPEVLEIEPDLDLEVIQIGDLDPNRLGIVLPLNASSISFYNNQISSRDDAMIQYYAGVKLALRKLESQGREMEVIIKDSEDSADNIDEIAAEFGRRGVSYIFGGKGRKAVESLANYAKENGMIYTSGWQVNSSFIGENENYVQFNPGFQAHALTILRHALQEFKPEQIILFGSEREASRIDEINRLYMEMTNVNNKLETLIVGDMNELELLEMKEWKLIGQDGKRRMSTNKVFIVPVTRNYNLIHDFFRFLDFNEMHERSIVYGMTDWNDDKLYSHLNNYDVRLTSFFNPATAQEYDNFMEQFFNMTGTIPNEKAYEGYNHLLLMADLMRKANSPSALPNLSLESPGMRVSLVDHNTLEYPKTDDRKKNSYLENQHVYLLDFKNYRYVIHEY